MENETMKDIIIRLENKGDYRATENLVREAFWNVYRPGCSEHYVMHVLRDDPAFIPELNLVMEQDGRPIGQNMFIRLVTDRIEEEEYAYPFPDAPIPNEDVFPIKPKESAPFLFEDAFLTTRAVMSKTYRFRNMS